MSTPPAKFCKVPLNAMPTATPADANTARNELVSMPKMPTMMMIRITFSEMDTRLLRNDVNDASIFLFCVIFRRAFMVYLMMSRPTKYTMIASNTFLPNCTI